jgi:hypothetical protein
MGYAFAVMPAHIDERAVLLQNPFLRRDLKMGAGECHSAGENRRAMPLQLLI